MEFYLWFYEKIIFWILCNKFYENLKHKISFIKHKNKKFKCKITNKLFLNS
jgi:hypothetical protein